MLDTRIVLYRPMKKWNFVTVSGHSSVVQYVYMLGLHQKGAALCLTLNSAFLWRLLWCKKQYEETSLVVESAFRGSGAEHSQLHKDSCMEHIKTQIYNYSLLFTPGGLKHVWWNSEGSDRGGCFCRSAHTCALIVTFYFVLYTEESSLTHSETLQ